ncbi:hypothetical protein SARI_00888 [Salmonella enterica subsp. arizonae serovar 62:z4,z23:-]|uniref:Uncharacterized protein n=1 Tax=Salmonella arizonae (strain ATCC BAA-731 / CDC346-86 / RSK2980) TaxID=41514 RepID=A9MLU1_SALAR|nr:hypothetical protein SARI_00888 [Salmonella enterica subsp. arizonae serovar 62:z4,z23:-]
MPTSSVVQEKPDEMNAKLIDNVSTHFLKENIFFPLKRHKYTGITPCH